MPMVVITLLCKIPSLDVPHVCFWVDPDKSRFWRYGFWSAYGFEEVSFRSGQFFLRLTSYTIQKAVAHKTLFKEFRP